MTNSVDPDQTTPSGAICPGSTLFAQICLSKNLGLLWYTCTLGLGIDQFFRYDICIDTK